MVILLPRCLIAHVVRNERSSRNDLWTSLERLALFCLDPSPSSDQQASKKNKRDILRLLLAFLMHCFSKLLSELLCMHTTQACPLYHCLFYCIGRNERRYRSRFSMLVKRHINQLATGHFADFACHQVFRRDLHSNFHTRATYVVHDAVNSHNITYISRFKEVEALELSPSLPDGVHA